MRSSLVSSTLLFGIALLGVSQVAQGQDAAKPKLYNTAKQKMLDHKQVFSFTQFKPDPAAPVSAVGRSGRKIRREVSALRRIPSPGRAVLGVIVPVKILARSLLILLLLTTAMAGQTALRQVQQARARLQMLQLVSRRPQLRQRRDALDLEPFPFLTDPKTVAHRVANMPEDRTVVQL